MVPRLLRVLNRDVVYVSRNHLVGRVIVASAGGRDFEGRGDRRGPIDAVLRASALDLHLGWRGLRRGSGEARVLWLMALLEAQTDVAWVENVFCGEGGEGVVGLDQVKIFIVLGGVGYTDRGRPGWEEDVASWSGDRRRQEGFAEGGEGHGGEVEIDVGVVEGARWMGENCDTKVFEVKD